VKQHLSNQIKSNEVYFQTKKIHRDKKEENYNYTKKAKNYN